MEEALAIQREAEIIQLTHWTFEEYDDQPADRLNRMMTYISMKNRIEAEKQQSDSKGSGGTGLTGRH